MEYSIYNEITKYELVVQYEGPKEEPIPPELDLGDFCPIKFCPFDALMQSYEEKLELEVSIPRKLYDEWEPNFIFISFFLVLFSNK